MDDKSKNPKFRDLTRREKLFVVFGVAFVLTAPFASLYVLGPHNIVTEVLMGILKGAAL